MISPVTMPFAERERLVHALADQAVKYPPGPNSYYRDLLNRVDLPAAWIAGVAGMWSGDALADARRLILWAISKDVNPRNPGFTTLGSLLTALLEDQGLEERRRSVAAIYAYRLYRDADLLAQLATRYQIPVSAKQPATYTDVDPFVASPSVELREPLDDLELQRFLRPEPDFLDIGFLIEAIRRSAAICRVETSGEKPLGTGFLVGQQTVLTNNHVIDSAPGNDVATKAEMILLRFGSTTAAQGKEAEGQVFRPQQGNALLRTSPTHKLDYALLRIDSRILEAEDLKPIEYGDYGALASGMGLSILGHPQGGPMKLAISSDGVARVYPDVGLIQYVTRALSGSSGSPCFNDTWQPVALHHAERARAFGSVREGVLLASIFSEIENLIV